MTQNTERRLVIGVYGGIVFGVVFSVPAAVIYAIWPNETFSEYGLTVLELFGLYFGGSMVGGLLVALLWPLTRWQAGATLLGILAAMPLFLGGVLLMSGSLTDPIDLLSAVAGAAVIGGGAGYRFWQHQQSSSSSTGMSR